MDPNELIKKTYGDSRLLILVAALLLAYGAFNLFVPLWSQRDGVVTADPFTYLSFARGLADGHFYLQGPLAEGIEALYGNESLVPGPIWNTNVRPDGRTVFTVAIGYPLFLAAVLKTAGMWACLAVNTLLLAGVAALVVLVVWEGTDRSPGALIAGGLAALLLVRSQPLTFQQFMDPWREPLFYVCILGGVFGVLRFMRTGRLPPLVPAGLLLGYACCIKETNVLYSGWVGLCLLASRTFRDHPRKGAVLAWFVGAGLLGLFPLLVQNHLNTGRFYVSLQFVRETSEYSISDAGAGISAGNFMKTLLWYVNIYRHHWLFRPAFLAVGLLGLAANLRYPVIRVLGGMLLLHLAVYLQWGRADFRHMYFAHIPYVVLLAAALRTVIEWALRRMAIRELFAPWILLLGLLAAAVWASPWQTLPPDRRVMQFDQARALARRIDGLSERPKLILSNRVLRDVLAVHSEHAVTRLGDLLRFDPEGDTRTVLEYFIGRGIEVYFVDNIDLDPRNAGRRDWSRRDRKLLLEHFDLIEADRLRADDYAMEPWVRRDELTVYRVAPWSRTQVRRQVATNSGAPAALLFVQPRARGDNLEVRVEGHPVVGGEYPFVPLHDLAAGPVLTVEAEADGATVPALADLRVYDWTEPIRLECGPDALPDDAFLFREPVGESPGGDFRYFLPDIRFRFPVRAAPDLFTTVGLGLNTMGTATGHVYITVQQFDEPEQLVEVASGRCYFPAPVAVSRPWAGPVDVTLRSRPGLLLKLSRVNLFSSVSRFEREVPAGGHGVALHGFLTPRAYGGGLHPWRVEVNGTQRGAGECLNDPGRTRNSFSLVLTDGAVEPRYHVEFDGAGLIKPEWVDIGERLEVHAGDAASLLWTDGFHPTEGEGVDAFRWSDGNARIKVPVGPDAQAYRLELDLLDGHPGEAPRRLTIRIGGAEAELTLPKERGVVAVELHGVHSAHRGLADVRLLTDPWVPSRVLPRSRDDRSLGFQLYGLRWERAAAP